MKLKRLNLVLLAIGLNFCSGCAINGQKIPFRDKFASLDFRKGDAGSASESGLSPEFLEAQKVFKKNPEGTLLAWARWQEDVGEYGEARKKYRELLIAYPDNPTNAPVRLELGRLYTHQEDWQKAIAAFEDASAIDRENQVCRYELGIAFARSHRYDQALSHLTYAVGESAANYNIGYVLHGQGNDADAAEWFQNALLTHPDTGTAEKTHAMLAQLSPHNSRARTSPPVYPSANPVTDAIIIASKEATTDQFEPTSFATPRLHATSTRSTSASSLVPSYVSSEADSSDHAKPPELRAAMIEKPDRSDMAIQASQPKVKSGDHNSLQTVSHAVPQMQTSQPENSGGQLHTGRGSRPQPLVTQEVKTTPAQWRGP
ncbi:MAG: tetratricopeptide repeat protein [Planctomycetales bacterium]|nr:tetratricopeptide repeat protein [Planctomycetales bacterium]